MLGFDYEEVKRKLGHNSERWQNIERQREERFQITRHKVETDPLKIFDAMSEDANKQ